MRNSQSDPTQDPPPLSHLLVCPQCQSAMKAEMETPVILAPGVETVTLVCAACGYTTIENAKTDEGS